MSEIAILGAGAWGSALALIANRAGRKVTLWGRSFAEWKTDRRPPRLEGVFIPDSVTLTDRLAEIDAPTILIALPTSAIIDTLRQRIFAAGTRLVICAKGFEPESGALLSEAIAKVAPDCSILVLSGPTFASEAARGAPTAATIAGPAPDAETVVDALRTERFRLYTSEDVVGLELAGAAKNVLAIACGVSDGLKLGDNARAALITRGLAEISRLVRSAGGKSETVMGLGGLGDVVLTCTSGQSRNYSFGKRLGIGLDQDEAFAESKGVVEGAAAVAHLLTYASTLSIDLPIAAAVHQVVNQGAEIEATVEALLSRPDGTPESG